MKTGNCRCGNRIFFNNFTCVVCETDLGRCGECGELTSFSDGRCNSCKNSVSPCVNRTYRVCNSFHDNANSLCSWCCFTTDIPDLSDPENVRRWAVMETAKRRLLLQLEELKLPPFTGDVQATRPVCFRFLNDTMDAEGNAIKVVTGHADGVITINLNEADTVHRERLRIDFGEPQRTLIGHMRHEIGHYIEYALGDCMDRTAYLELFGDPEAINYQEAMQRHYDNGPPKDWADSHVSAYATMHPWEDFAETVNVYLDIMAIATTANDQGCDRLDISRKVSVTKLVPSVLKIAIEVSEYNFDLGLGALLPERLSPAVLEKLAFIHSLRLVSSMLNKAKAPA